MSAVLYRQLRAKLKAAPNLKHILLCGTLNVKSPIRHISSTSLSYSRVPPRQKPSLIQQTGKAQTPQEPETEDIKTRAQLLLEESAAPVVVEDMEKSKEIIEHGSYETFILMVLTRLQPILFYCLHHDPVEFLEGFAYPESAVGRARDATLWLFISAHAWFTRAAAHNAPLLIPLSEDVIHLAELFAKAGTAVETYVETKGSDAPWFDVGTLIVECAHQAWKVLPDDIGLFEGVGQDDTNVEQSREEPALSTGTSPVSAREDRQGDSSGSFKGGNDST